MVGDAEVIAAARTRTLSLVIPSVIGKYIYCRLSEVGEEKHWSREDLVGETWQRKL